MRRGTVAGDEKSIGESMSVLLEIIPRVTAAASFMVLVLAFVHEWAFYYVIGNQFQSLVSVTDYFNSAITWMPWAGVGLVSALLWTLADPLQKVPTAVKDQYYKEHRVRWFIDKAPIGILLWSLTAAGAYQFLFGDWYTRAAIEFFFMFLWIRIITLIARQNANTDLITKDVAYLIVFTPLFLIMAFSGGWNEGAIALHPKVEANAIGRLKKEYRERDWYVMRSLSNGLILRDLTEDGEKIQFVRWDDIANFSTKIVQPNRNGLVCRVTGQMCLPVPDTEKPPKGP
jgi:hypothetical protein